MSVEIVYVEPGDTDDILAKIPRDAPPGDMFLVVKRDGESLGPAALVFIPPRKPGPVILGKPERAVSVDPVVNAFGTLIAELATAGAALTEATEGLAEATKGMADAVDSLRTRVDALTIRVDGIDARTAR